MTNPAANLHWKKLPPLPDAQGFAGAFAGVSGSALIVGGGANIVGNKWSKDFSKQWYDSVFVLDDPQGHWRTGFRLPRALGYGVSITTSNSVVCIGGSDASKHYADVFQMSWSLGELRITHLPSLPKTCANSCGVLIGQTIYVAGGIETPTATTALKTFWSLDLAGANPRWMELEPWPGPERMLAVAGAMDGKFYLISGVSLKANAEGKPVREYLRDAYAYKPGKGWRQLADLPHAVTAAPSPAIANHKLLIISGDDGSCVTLPQTPAHPGFSRDVLAYDDVTDQWSVVGKVPFSRATTATIEWLGHVVVPMGEVRPRERTSEVWWAELPKVSP